MNGVLDLGAVEIENAARAQGFPDHLGDALADPIQIASGGGGIGLSRGRTMGARLVPEGEDGDGIGACGDAAYREEARENYSRNCRDRRALHILSLTGRV